MTRPRNALIRFEGDAYDIGGGNLMGRQSAGFGFLRAAVAGRGNGAVGGYGPEVGADALFAKAVAAIDPEARPEWRGADEFGAFNRWGVCHMPHPALGPDARLRLRTGPAKYSLCGVTHTTSTGRTMDALASVLTDPLEPWDAIICTSQAVLETIRRVHEVEAEYLKWRFGAQARIAAPQLPVIPLGVHCDDFAFAAGERDAARDAMGIGPSEVVALFVGRYSVVTKAHPLPMYRALQVVAERTGKAVTLVQAGWGSYPNAQAEFESGAAQWAPSIRSLFVDGRQPDQARQAWAAADLFISLADNIQETFGLTPIEAMACGLPVVVTDWNGYKETVRDGVDGFRVKTWAPDAGFGAYFAMTHEAQTLMYERYLLRASSATSLDLAELVDRLSALVEDPVLRRTMGEAGRARARATFDWSVVYRQYQALWGELEARRRSILSDADEVARVSAAPRVTAARQDAFHVFGHYPSARITPESAIMISPDASLEGCLAMIGHPLVKEPHASAPLTQRLWPALSEGSPLRIKDLAQRADCRVDVTLLAVANLVKLGFVIFVDG